MSASEVRAPLRLRAARHAVRAIFRLLFRPRLEGVPPAIGPYILALNHQGWADAFLVLALFPPTPRLHFLGDRQAVEHVWWKRAVMWFFGGVVRIDRTRRSDAHAIDGALRCVEGGGVLVIFAEGRVSRAEGELAPFQRGVGYLAMKARVPVLPVWLRGTGELYLGRELVARLGDLRVPPDEALTKESTASFTARLHDDVAALVEPWEEPAGVRKRMRWLTNIL